VPVAWKPGADGEVSEWALEVLDCLLYACLLAELPGWLKAEVVGEKVLRSGLSLELPGLVCPMLPVLMGARPLRGVCLVVVPGQGDCCDLVPRPPVGVGVTASVKDGSCWAEDGRKVIDVARTSGPAHGGGGEGGSGGEDVECVC